MLTVGDLHQNSNTHGHSLPYFFLNEDLVGFVFMSSENCQRYIKKTIQVAYMWRRTDNRKTVMCWSENKEMGWPAFHHRVILPPGG